MLERGCIPARRRRLLLGLACVPVLLGGTRGEAPIRGIPRSQQELYRGGSRAFRAMSGGMPMDLTIARFDEEKGSLLRGRERRPRDWVLVRERQDSLLYGWVHGCLISFCAC